MPETRSRPGSGISPFLPGAPPRRRLDFIDLLRGWAVIVMIETHVFNATLRPDLMDGTAFKVLNFINGLVAPSFLFASGLAYAVTTRRKLNDYLSFGPPLVRQLARLLLVLVIGYALHIPKFDLRHLLNEASPAAWAQFFQVDILQCIAVSLLTMQLLLLSLRTERRMYRTLVVVTPLIVAVTPLVWSVDAARFLPVPLAAYVNSMHQSLFPLFPWSAFLFAGALTGYAYLEAPETPGMMGVAARWPAMRVIAWWGVGFVLLSFAIDPIASAVYPVYDYWHTSPSFFLLRLGLVIVVLTGLFAYERFRGVAPSSFVTLIGRESLLVYTTHLMIIYGNYRGTFAERFHGLLGYGEALIGVLALLLAMWLLALAWSRIKKGRPIVRIGVELAVLAGFLAVFLVGIN